MAATSTFTPAKRRKPVVYGKASRNAWNAIDMDARDDTAVMISGRAVKRTPEVKDAYPVSKREKKLHGLKPIKQRVDKQDTWDVPSSDEGENSSPQQPGSSIAKLRGKRDVASRTSDADAKLAPWEKNRTEAKKIAKQGYRAGKEQHSSADEQLRNELLIATHERSSPNSPREDKHLQVQAEHYNGVVFGSEKTAGQAVGSAAARLQARKLQNTVSSSLSSEEITKMSPLAQKRIGEDIDKRVGSPRKRSRHTSPQIDNRAQIDPSDTTSKVSSCALQVKNSPEDTDMYDVPGSAVNNKILSQIPKSSSETKSRHRPGRERPTTLIPPRTRDSATTKLTEMVSTKSDIPGETPSVATCQVSTPQKSDGLDEEASRSTTPKRREPWKQLLSHVPVAPSPGALAMQNLNLNGRRSASTADSRARGIPQSASDVGPRTKTKLVDRLKATAFNTDDESDASDDMDADSAMEKHELRRTNEDPEHAEVPLRQSQTRSSQSQPSLVSNTGSKVTYARTRSYLPEDSLEAHLMFDMVGETPRAAARASTSKTNQASAQSGFDVEDSDEETGARGMRTIHELRAGGGNQRFMDSIGGLLEDISDHDVSARSRRRSALIDIASRLLDDAFAEKFLRQGYELQLTAECSADPDDVADFILCVSFSALLAGEPSQHTVQCLKDRDVFAWATRMLNNRTAVKELTTTRRNNMSRSAQLSFAHFVAELSQRPMWAGKQPVALSPRVVALKLFEQLTAAVRRSGDRSELVPATSVEAILPSRTEIDAVEDFVDEVTMAISSLESLSTTTVSLDWLADSMERLNALMRSVCLAESKHLQHVLFLCLRLCLNLTTDHQRNCKVFSKPQTVLGLLQQAQRGFDLLAEEREEEERGIKLDLLVLSQSMLINLAEQSDTARAHAATAEAGEVLCSLVLVFRQAQQQLVEAESAAQGANNVAYGYLAVLLASLCRGARAKALIASALPGQKLQCVVSAVEEFVRYHQTVDQLNFEGEEGSQVWSSFTERLQGVLVRLRAECRRRLRHGWKIPIE